MKKSAMVRMGLRNNREKTLVKTLKLIPLYVTNLVTSVFIQAILLSTNIWYYDMSIEIYIIYILIALVVLFVNYFVNGIILHRADFESLHKCWVHLPDLILCIPNVWFALRHFNSLSGIFVLVVAALLTVERILLIKKY